MSVPNTEDPDTSWSFQAMRFSYCITTNQTSASTYVFMIIYWEESESSSKFVAQHNC